MHKEHIYPLSLSLSLSSLNIQFNNKSTMAFSVSAALDHNLSKPTSFFGVKLWIAILICTVSALSFALIFTLVYIFRRCKRKLPNSPIHHAPSNNYHHKIYNNWSMDRRPLSREEWDDDVEMSIRPLQENDKHSGHWPCTGEMINVDSCLGRVTFREIEATTNGLALANVIGSGPYGAVFRGFLIDNTQVAIKMLFSNRSGKQDFSKEAEAMLLIRHKNLVKLLGYCAEGAYRLLVYEYVENGSLNEWLHQCISKVSPLTWNIRMQIIIGIAKGLAYLHEDSEPQLVHRNLKSSNVLIDRQWNPKISDVGITKLLGPEWKDTTAPPTGMSGYIAPEYEGIHVVDEKSDVYSFGVLIMEIVSGKATLESSGNEIEEYLIDWMKSMVAEEKYDLIVDPNLADAPTIKDLKRVLLVALRCVDFDVGKRPRMGDIVSMLKPRDLLLCDEHLVTTKTYRSRFFKL